jgi:hypothetical protein
MAPTTDWRTAVLQGSEVYVNCCLRFRGLCDTDVSAIGELLPYSMLQLGDSKLLCSHLR